VNTNKSHIQCESVFKQTGNIGMSLSNLWAEIINYTLENHDGLWHNEDVQSRPCQILKD